MSKDPFDPENLSIDPAELIGKLAVLPAKIQKRREQFAMVPMVWLEKLKGAGAITYLVAVLLCHLHWKGRGEPIKLANGMMALDGVSRESKRRALRDLERRGLISVEWRSRKSPVVTVYV